MATDVGQLPPLPSDGCDVEDINDEDLLRRMWQAAEDFGRKKEIRARMYKLREKRLREFYTTGEVLKDVQSADPAIREETPKRGGTTYRELVVGELRAGDHFDIREKTAEQTTELIQTSDGAPQEIHSSLSESVTVIFDSRTVVSETGTTYVDSHTTFVESHSAEQELESSFDETVQDMLDTRASPRESPSPTRSSSRRSSKSSPSREVSSRKSSVSSVKLASSPTTEVPSRKNSETKMPSPSREVSSRRSSTTENSREVSSRKSSYSETREVSSHRSSTTETKSASTSPQRKVSSRRSSETKLASPTREVSSRLSNSSETREASSPVREISSSRKSSVSDVRASPTRDSSTSFRQSSTSSSEMKIVSTSSSRDSASVRTSSTGETKIICSSPTRDAASVRKSSTGSSSPTRDIASIRKSSTGSSETKIISTSFSRDNASVRKSSTGSSEMKIVSSSPTRDSAPVRKSSNSNGDSQSVCSSPTKDVTDDVQYSTFSSVTLVKQQDGARVTSPNRRKLSSAGSKARRAGTPSASPPRSPTHEKEVHEEISDDEVTNVRDIKSKFEEAAKPKSILRTPDRKKSAIETFEAAASQNKVSEITMQVKQEAVAEVKQQEIQMESQVKRAVAEVKLESSSYAKKSELVKKAEPEKKIATKEITPAKIDAKEFQKEARASSIRRRSREQVEDSTDRDSSCSPVRSRTHSKSKVSSVKAEVTTATATSTTVTSTATLKRPTKLPMLNNKTKESERGCCGRKHGAGAASPDKPWRQSPMQSPKKTSPTATAVKTPQKAANRSPSSSPERPAPAEVRQIRRPMAQKSPAVTSPTKRTVESPVKKPVTDRAATTSCLKSPAEKPAPSRIASRSATSPIKPETSRFQRKPAETTPRKATETTPVRRVAESTTTVRKTVETTLSPRKAIPTYQRPLARTTATTTTTTNNTSTLRQTQQKTAAFKNGRSLSGSKMVEPKAVQKPSPKVAPKEMPTPSVKVSKPVESEEESAGFSTDEDETVTELEDIRYSSANLLDTEDEERVSSRRQMEAMDVRQTQIQQLSRDSSPEGRPQRFADRVSEPESDFETTKRERTPLEVVVPPGGLDGLQEEEGEDEEPALLSVADKANIFLTTDLSKTEKKTQVFETNKAVSLAKAVFERKDDDEDEARKKYERDIMSRPSVFSKVTDRIKNFDNSTPQKTPEPIREPVRQEKIREIEKEPAKQIRETIKETQKEAPKEAPKEETRLPVEEPLMKLEKVVPLCSGDEEPPKASVSRASGKFGVTLRRTSSRLSDVTAPKEEALEIKPVAASPAPEKAAAVEEITDVRQLELMLEKATNYDERRQLRAAIRDAKKTQTIFTTTSTTKVTTNVTRKTSSPTRQQVNGRRSVSPVKTDSVRKNSSPGRKQEEDGNSISTPLRVAEQQQPQPQPQLVKQPSTGKLDKGKFASFQKEENSTSSASVTIKRKTSTDSESVRKVSAPPREVNPTCCVTSSYGVGPQDETGRPLFGLRALRKTQEASTDPAPEVADVPDQRKQETPQSEVTDYSGRPLFGGLSALRKKSASPVAQEKEAVDYSESEDFLDSSAEDSANMPELQTSTGQLKSLVERHEQNTKTSSTTTSSNQKPKAKLRDSFVTQESRTKLVADAHKASKTEALVNRSERSNSLKAIIKKHENSSDAPAPTPAAEPARKISTDQVKSILKKPRESTPETTVVSSAAICLRRDSTDRRPEDIEQESTVEDEDGNKTVVKNVHRERSDGNTKASFSATSRSHTSGDGTRSSSHSSSTTVMTSKGKDAGPISIARVGRSGSVRALQQKFQQTAMESSSPEPRSYQKAGLIFRTNSFKHTNGDKHQGDGKEICEESSQRTEQVTENEGSVERRVTETRVVTESASTSRSFLGNNAKVTGVQDVLSRMREADNEQDDGMSAEDREAKALLNKFLGASVLMQGIEPLLQAQSPSLVSQVEKQRLAIAQEEKPCGGAANDFEVSNDQAYLRKLLDAATDYDTRRQIRARLRTVMADNKVNDGSDAAADSASRSVHGELLPLAVDQLMATLENNFPVVNNGGGGDGEVEALGDLQECEGPAVDSGTESGEDPRTPNSQSQLDLAPLPPKKPVPTELPPELLDEVMGALAKLQGSLQMAAGEDVEPERREAILALVSRLQGSLPPAEKAPQPTPRKKKQAARHTVGVSGEELEDARRLADSVAASVPFSPLQRPSDFNARIGKEENFEVHDPVNALTLKKPLHRRSFSQGAQRPSVEEDPSQLLFTPEQTVQIAIHKAAINKQISQEEDIRKARKASEREGSVEAELNSANGCDLMQPIDVGQKIARPPEPGAFSVKKLPEFEKPKSVLRTKSLEEGTKNISVFQPADLRAPDMVKSQEKYNLPPDIAKPQPVEEPLQLQMEEKPIVPFKQPTMPEVPKPIFPKSEPISKPIFAAKEAPRPVFSKNELQKPVASKPATPKPATPKLDQVKPEPPKPYKPFNVTPVAQKMELYKPFNVAPVAPKVELYRPFNVAQVAPNVEPYRLYVAPKVEPVEAKPPVIRAPSEFMCTSVQKPSKLSFEISQEEEEPSNNSGVIWGSILQSSKDGERKVVSRAEKKRKLKRANTIDIPKPFDMQDMQDSDDEDYLNGDADGTSQRSSLDVPFVPKTENDRKFLAFLERKSPNNNSRPSSCSMGGHHWTNRFSNLKTNFEKSDKKEEPKPKPQEAPKPIWAQKPAEPAMKRPEPKPTSKPVYEQKRKNSLPTINPPKKDSALPWAGNEGHVVVGSLTVMQNQSAVQQKKQMFSAKPTAEPPMPKPETRPPIAKPMPPMIKTVEPKPLPPPAPAVPDKSLMDMQRQQQMRYVQQKEEQERYRLQRRQREEAERERIRGPAPIGNFNHAQNSAFRPIAKRDQAPKQSTQDPPPSKPRIEYSASVATETRQLNMRIFNDPKKDEGQNNEEELEEVDAPLTIMTAVSRVKEGPKGQHASVVQSQVQRRNSPSRSSLAKSHLRSLLPRDDDDSPSCLTRSSHSTSDMMDSMFQARYDASATSSRSSSIVPRHFDSPHDEVLSLKLEFPLHQPSPLPFSPPTQRRTFDPSVPSSPGLVPLRKCESWHQMRPQSLLSVPNSTPPLRRSPSGAKIHLFSKQFEAQVSPDRVEDKQRQVMAYLTQQAESPPKSPAKSPRPVPIPYNRQDTLRGIVHDDDLENVDEEFERLFESSVRPARLSLGSRAPAPERLRLQRDGDAVRSVRLSHSVPSSPTGKRSEFSVKSSSSTSTIQLDGGTKISSVSSTMTSNTRVSKAPPSKLKMSPFDKFRQLDEQNSSPSPSTPKTPGGSNSGPLFKFTDAGLNRSASNVKERLLYWCQVKTKEYKDLKIENFSTSWNNGMAFCALIHHFYPDAFNYEELRPENRRKNFELAFRVADEKADIAPLLDVDDMVMMKKPDWKCVFTYVQSIYRRLKDEEI